MQILHFMNTIRGGPHLITLSTFGFFFPFTVHFVCLIFPSSLASPLHIHGRNFPPSISTRLEPAFVNSPPSLNSLATPARRTLPLSEPNIEKMFSGIYFPCHTNELIHAFDPSLRSHQGACLSSVMVRGVRVRVDGWINMHSIASYLIFENLTPFAGFRFRFTFLRLNTISHAGCARRHDMIR